MQSYSSPDEQGSLSQRILADAKNAEELASPVWLSVFFQTQSQVELSLEQGELTVHKPWSPGVALITRHEDKLPDEELRERAKRFHNNQLKAIREMDEAAAKRQKDQLSSGLAEWNQQKQYAFETKNWSNLVHLFEKRLSMWEKGALNSTASVLRRLGLYSVANKI